MKITNDRLWNLAIIFVIAVCVALDALGVKL